MLRGFNVSGGRVWMLLDGRRTAGEIAREVARDAGEREARVLDDVMVFLSRLHGLGLVELVKGGD